jgi:hypothetical protein
LDRKFVLAPALAACCALLAACGSGDRDATAAGAGGDTEAPLPKPEAGAGSVTGMPDSPGPGHVGTPIADADADALPAPVDGDAEVLLPPGDALPAPPADGSLSPPQVQVQAPAEPTPAEAVAVVQAYYAAIAAQQYPRAYALWSGGGDASGQTAQQFAGGFADTATVSAEVGAPGRVDAAAGSRYIEIPVSITATRRDGSIHRYAGAYTLRRAVVDGATDEQRAWRIASADLREVRP